jgi:hypothetical protein
MLPDIFPTMELTIGRSVCLLRKRHKPARVAELGDALDLGSSPPKADRGSTPLSRTK